MEVPLVSVLMTAYNREQFIGEAIESVCSSSFTDFELIIVDDCSSDNTLAIARQYETSDKRIRVFSNPQNLGDYPNRNRAAGLARGKYLKYVDSDDLLYRHGLELFVSTMEKFPEAMLALSSTAVQLEKPFPILLRPDVCLRHHFFNYSVLDGGPSGAMIRRDAFFEIGQFSGTRLVGDTELWIKLACRFPVIVVNPSLVFWRQHAGQEYRAPQAHAFYLSATLPMLRNALRDSSMALTEQEKKVILHFYQTSTLRALVKHAVYERTLTVLRKFLRENKIGLLALLESIFLRPTLKTVNN